MSDFPQNETITVSEFSKEMDRIEEIQDEVSDILNSKNPFIYLFYFLKAERLHAQAEELMLKLFQKELVEDPQ